MFITPPSIWLPWPAPPAPDADAAEWEAYGELVEARHRQIERDLDLYPWIVGGSIVAAVVIVAVSLAVFGF
ncbi:hypothetical protein FHR71_001752 [Methylobacterium sp. RAS18]|nr:hypothetical protein [Methylobacterium sp. RAS18]